MSREHEDDERGAGVEARSGHFHPTLFSLLHCVRFLNVIFSQVAHPPGYPLFTMLAWLAVRLLPATSPAHAVNVLCAVLGALASGALCYTVCR